jgi:uncharacterized protein
MIYKILFYGSFLVFPFVILLMIGLWQGRWPWLCIALMGLSLLFIYARFIEPQMLIVRYESLMFSGTREGDSEIKVALFADNHLGSYKDRAFMQKVVDRVKYEQPDLVLIPGDFIFAISREQLFDYFQPLKDLNIPVFATTGNHDYESAGYIELEEVRQMLRDNGVEVLDDLKTEIEIKGKKLKIYGLRDLWEKTVDNDLLADISGEENVIVIAHNPDTAHYMENLRADLLVSGHTHGGQIRIPWLYPLMIPSEFGYDRGWYEFEGMKMYVTSGAGEVGLPMRLGVPPEIVIIKLNLK